METLAESLNNFGSSISGSFGSVLAVNNAICSIVVRAASFLILGILDLITNLLLACWVLTEELAVFLQESFESVTYGIFLLGDAVDRSIGLAFDGVSAISNFILGVFRSFQLTIGACVKAVFDLGESTTNFIRLLGSSILLLISLIPQTINLTYQGIISLCHSIFGLFTSCLKAAFSILTTTPPIELVVGLSAALVFVYSVYKLLTRVTFRSAVGLVIELYLNALRGILAGLTVVFQCFIVILSHTHVPRFHHAEGAAGGDESQAEDGADVVSIDDSDGEGRAIDEERAKRHATLARLRNKDRRRTRNQDLQDVSTDDDDENWLLEQVEREREDKLCVICQDREKCVMILPCRHLCICDECQRLIQQRTKQNKSCPMCRKGVKQMIKAYL